jgi:hypothetical protein
LKYLLGATSEMLDHVSRLLERVTFGWLPERVDEGRGDFDTDRLLG